MECREPRRLRLGCLGDSWVSDWRQGPSSCLITSPISAALRAGLEGRHIPVEHMVAAGFPGGRADRLLEFAEICRLRDLAVLSSRGRSIKGDPMETLLELGIPVQPRGSFWEEGVDVLVIILGANDLNHEAPALDVVQRLHRLWRLYERRGARVILVTVGGGKPGSQTDWPEFEKQRLLTNKMLLRDEGAVDCDMLLRRVWSESWENDWHLTEEGYMAVGDLLAEALAVRLRASSTPLPICGGDDTDASSMLVSGCHIPLLSDVLTGTYELAGENCGRPLYKKTRVGEEAVCIFFWGTAEAAWCGWWFGPERNWEHPGWARHPDTDAPTPPKTGWRVPAHGPLDKTLTLTLRAPRLWADLGCAVSSAAWPDK